MADPAQANSSRFSLWNAPENRRYLIFAWALASLSTIGAGYFVGLFNPSMREAFGISNTEISLIFTITTLASAPLMMWIGALIDRMDIGLYFMLVAIGLAIGCVVIGLATAVPLLAVGILLVRLMGDWLFPHTAITSLVRYFAGHRGQVSGLLAIGYGVGAGLMPLFATSLAQWLGWRQTWLVLAALVVAAIPLCLMLLGNRKENQAFRRPASVSKPAGAQDWSVWHLLRDRKFFLAVFVAVSFPLMMSGLFFHQGALAEARGWPLSWLAACYIAFALCQLGSMLLVGALIDRHGAIALMPLYPLSLVIGIGALFISDHPLTAIVYLGGAGFASGMFLIGVSIMWAELYGTERVGSIRAFVQAMVLVIIAGATISIGILLDWGISFDAIALAHMIAAAATVGLAFMLRPFRP